MAFRVGIDIGGTKINIGILQDGQLVANRVYPVPTLHDCPAVLRFAAQQMAELLAENGLSLADVSACGIGVPGTVLQDHATVVKVPNLHWENINAADIFQQLTGLRPTLLQDARAAAYGEYAAGNAQGMQHVLCVTLGTGIGTGFVQNGQILFGAGSQACELGHVPAVENGRPCGCGKNGCVECYAAGKGLDMTARELYGPQASARTLFQRAGQDPQAAGVIADAVQLLGRTLVAAVNLLAPDCLIISGGLSAQRQLFYQPLAAYIASHIYAKQLTIAPAKWEENAPMVGAALYAKPAVLRKPKLSASIMCGHLVNLQADLRQLEQAQMDYIHIDVMDGHFVPNMMLPPLLGEQIAADTDIPLDYHLMVENPDALIDRMKVRPGDIITVHYESTPHIQRTLQLIRDKGAQVGLAINPGTPFSAVAELMSYVDMLLIMTVNPGFAGQKIVPHSFEKIAAVRQYLDAHGLERIMLQVDGNCSFENLPKLWQAGADCFVVGSSSVFHPDYTMVSAAQKLRDDCAAINP